MSTSPNGPTTLEYLTFAVVALGFILTLISKIREWRKDRRSLKIILELVHWMEIYRLVITSPNPRPITIDEINLSINNKKGEDRGPIPSHAFWTNEREYKPPNLPLTLNEHDEAIFYLSNYLSERLRKPNNHLVIKVYDAEGKVYSKYKEGEYDPKYGYRTGKYKQPNILSRAKSKVINKIRDLISR